MLTAVAIVILFIIMPKASQNETRRLTRDMGLNLRIIPQETDRDDFWTSGYSDRNMSESFVQVLVDKKSLDYAQLTATLHKRIKWNGMETILTGISL